jgi:hypothetical protein
LDLLDGEIQPAFFIGKGEQMAAPHIAHGIRVSTGSPFAEASVDFSNTSDNTIVSATAGQSIRVYRIFFVTSADTTITFKDGSTGLTGAITMFAGGAFVLDYQDLAWFVTTVGSAFVISQTGTAQISGRIWYQKP